MTELTFEEHGAGDDTVLSVSGEIDMATVPELRSKVDDLDVAHRTLVLDLNGVEFVDSSGLGALLGIKKQQDRGGGRLVLSQMSAPVVRILQITRMDRVFTVADDD